MTRNKSGLVQRGRLKLSDTQHGSDGTKAIYMHDVG